MTIPQKNMKNDDRNKEPRVDRRIRVPEVLVIDSDGNKLGTMPTYEALKRAQDQGLNLVEVAPNSRPPVCRILDYGKYKYDQKQDQKRRKKNQIFIDLKEVKFRPKVEKHDFEFKVRHCVRFLGQGDKVKATIMFRGRELAHTELGEVILKRLLTALEGKVVVESTPRLEGRNMSMLIAPKPGAWPKKPKPEPKADGDRPERVAKPVQKLDAMATPNAEDDDDDEIDETDDTTGVDLDAEEAADKAADEKAKEDKPS
jgi:translation initiation factor IF-3